MDHGFRLSSNQLRHEQLVAAGRDWTTAEPAAGFVLPVALSRFDQRKQLIVDEANAIGTAQLRAYRLPASAREKMLGLLREYVGARTRFAETRVHDQGFDQAIVDGQQLHNQMWRESVEVAKTTPNAITSLFIQSLNDAIYAKSG